MTTNTSLPETASAAEHVTHVYFEDGTDIIQARCTCPWTGPERRTGSPDARKDAKAHRAEKLGPAVNLMACSLGNGIVVSDTTREEHGDYLRIAHIGHDRVIAYHGDVPAYAVAYVEQIAYCENPGMSHTQPEMRAFSIPAPGPAVLELHRRGDHAACPVRICPDAAARDGEEATCRGCGHDITWCAPKGYTNLRKWCDPARSAACWANGYNGHQPTRTTHR